MSGLVGAREKRTAPQNVPGDWSEWMVSRVKAFPGALLVWVTVVTLPGTLNLF